MPNSKKYFLISLLIAFSLYLFIVVFILINFNDNKSKNITAKKYSNIEISIVSTKIHKKSKKIRYSKTIKQVAITKPKAKPIKKEIKREKLIRVFDDVKLKTIKQPKKITYIETKVVKQEKYKPIKLSSTEKTKISDSIEDIFGMDEPTSVGEYVDSYEARINDIFQNHWSNTIATVSGNEARISITIDNRGKMTYKILRLSTDERFNEKLKEFLINMSNITFDEPLDGTSTIGIILKDEEDV